MQLEVIAEVRGRRRGSHRRLSRGNAHRRWSCAPGCADFDIVVRAFAEGADAPHHEVLVHIADYHTNVVREERDGAVVLRCADGCGGRGQATGFADRSLLTMEGIWDFAMTVRPGATCVDLVDRQVGLQRPRSPTRGFRATGAPNIGRVMLGALRRRRERCAPAARRRGGVRRAHERLRAAGGHQLRQRQPGHHRASVPVIVYARGAGRPPTTSCCRALRAFEPGGHPPEAPASAGFRAPTAAPCQRRAAAAGRGHRVPGRRRLRGGGACAW